MPRGRDEKDLTERTGVAEDAEPSDPDTFLRRVAHVSAVPLNTAGAGARTFKPSEVVSARYRIEEFLGEGGMGEVYQAEDLGLHERVALKTIRPQIAASPEALERFKREIKLSRKVTHRNICRVFDLGEHQVGQDGTPRTASFFTMELLRGESLAQRLRRDGKLDPREALSIVEQIGAGLAAAHAADVVHRDFKSGNVMLVPDATSKLPRAVITDFGLARGMAADMSRLTAPTHELTAGTPAYMAPEQVEGKPVTAAADIYALGIVMHEMLTGKLPFEADSPLAMAVKRLKEDPPSVRTLDPELDARWDLAISRCLEREPGKRFSSATELVDALRARRKRVRPRTLFVAGAIVTLLVAVAGLAWWQLGPLPARDRRVIVTVKNEGDAADEWIAQPLQAMAAHRLARDERRFAVVEDPKAANVSLRLAYRRASKGLSVRTEGGPSRGRASRWVEGEGDSVAAALEQVLPHVAGRLGEGQPDPGVTDAERAAMKRLGTGSVEAYRLYRSGEEYWHSLKFDAPPIEKRLEEAIRLDPGWAHAYAMKALVQGVTTLRAAATVAQGWRISDPSADPAGRVLLDVLRLRQQSKLEGVSRLLEPVYGADPSDLLTLTLLGGTLVTEHRLGDAAAIARHALHDRPDLQFGADLEGILRQTGRAEEIPAVQERWLAAAPDNEQALASQVYADVEAERFADAERHARELLFLHGEAPHRLVTLCDVLTAAGQFVAAREIGDRLVKGTEQDQLERRYRLGLIAIYEGRFASAYDELVVAARGGRKFGMDFESYQAYQALLSVTPDRSEALQLQKELAAVYEGLGDRGGAAAARFEAAVTALDGGACPDRERWLAKVPDEMDRNLARRHMLRTAADVGCASCADVVALGLSSTDGDGLSLVRFGRCAEKEGALELARDAFNRARLARDALAPGSPYHSILARFHLARVLERQGKPAEARRWYEDFVAHWGHADRPVPEVDQARAALARLAATR
jgi:tetratricopeptide (TPR) repeat protein